MDSDEKESGNNNRNSWFEGDILSPQEIEDERAKQIERDAREHEGVARFSSHQQQEDCVRPDVSNKPAEEAGPRMSYDRKMEQYWQKEFSLEPGNTSLSSTRSGRDEEPDESGHSEKEVVQDKMNQHHFAVSQSHPHSKPQSRTSGQFEEERSMLNHEGNVSSENSMMDGRGEFDAPSQIVPSSPHHDVATVARSPVSHPAPLPPRVRVIPRAPVAAYKDHRSPSTDTKPRSVPTTSQIVDASSGETVRHEDSLTIPGAYAHIGPDGRLPTQSTTSNRGAMRYSVTADDLLHSEDYNERLLQNKSSNGPLSGSAEFSSELARLQEEAPAVHDGVGSGGNAAYDMTHQTINGTPNQAVASPGQNHSSRLLNRLVITRPTETATSASEADGLVNAEMVNDAEPVVYAENVERTDLLYKNPFFLGSIGCVSLGALIALVFVLVAPTKERTGDPRCWVRPEQLNVPMQCYCFGTPEAHVNNLLKDGDSEGYFLYNMSQMILKEVGVLDSTITNSSLLDEWEEGNIYSCDPINQCLLAATAIGSSLTRDQILGAPVDVFADVFVICQIYVTMGGINWTRNDGWFGSTRLCEWHGLGCIFLGVYSQLSFPRNNLQGTIPGAMMQHLKRIRHLDFSGNPGIVGTIPTELSAMTSLNHLDLSGCSLSGTIPAELGSLELLDSLSLGRNHLSGTLPPRLFNRHSALSFGDGEIAISPLRSVDVQANQLTGVIPSEIHRATRLSFLRMQKNKLTGTLPSEISQLTYLELLNIGENRFSGTMPEAIACIPRFKMMNFNNSGLEPNVSILGENGTSSLRNGLLETFCPNNRTTCGGIPLPESRRIVLECSTTPHDCSCCVQAHQEQTRLDFKRAAIQVICAEDVPEFAVSLGF